MIRIRCSGTPAGEVDLSGTRQELLELREAIVNFCRKKRPLLEVPVEREYDPAPYERRLYWLRLVRTAHKTKILIEGQRLFVTGRLDLLKLFAENLPCEAEQTPYHVHLGANGMAEQVEADSLDLVVTLTG